MFPYRDRNKTHAVPYITNGLILINVAVFAYVLTLSDSFAGFSGQQYAEFIYEWGAVPARIFAGKNLETIFTSMFIHSGWMHIISNMLFLYVFGDNLEARLGRIKFLLFYLASGVAAFGLQGITDTASLGPMIGASGAVAGVLGGYLVFFPHAAIDSIFIFFFLVQRVTTSARYIIIYWFLIQVFFGVATIAGPGGGIAYFAHIGGFAFGWLAAKAIQMMGRGDNTNTHFR